MSTDGSSDTKIKLKPLKKYTGGEEDSIPSPEPKMTDSQHRLTLKLHKKEEQKEPVINQDLTQAKTEVGMPVFKREQPSEGTSNFLYETDDILEKQPGDSGEYLMADDDHNPDATVHSPTEVVEMECVECGETAMYESGIETAKCRKCGGVMYPQGLFDGEATVSYFASQPEEEVNYVDIDKKSIKVAQPVTVGMFSGSSGTVNPTASSQNLKPLDFFSQTSSTNSVPLSPQDSNPSGSVVTAELLDEMSRERKNLSEEKARLKQQQLDFDNAVTEFEERAKQLEQLRLELELKNATAEESQENIEEYDEDLEETAKPRRSKASLLLIIFLILIVAVQAAAIVYMLFFWKR